jgi:hypothetical protein
MKKPISSLAIGVCLLALSAGVAFATGQPGTSNGVNCLAGPSTALTPGHSATSQAPFNEPAPLGSGAGGNSGMHFAGQPNSGSLNSNNPNAVSQYDIACQNFTAAKSQLH